jgi:hypothetical protein
MMIHNNSLIGVVGYLFLIFHRYSGWSNESLCNPDVRNYFKVKQFLAKRWNDARHEIGLDRLPESALVSDDIINHFYSFSTGIIFWNINSTIFSYARIYKCKIFIIITES